MARQQSDACGLILAALQPDCSPLAAAFQSDGSRIASSPVTESHFNRPGRTLAVLKFPDQK
jgi:hypothetical protein